MKKIVVLVMLLANYSQSMSQQSVDSLITRNRTELIQKLVDLPCGIKTNEGVLTMLNKLENFLNSYQPSPQYKDDLYALEAAKQALISVKKGGYGIGAVLVNQEGKIIHAAHNAQLTKMRSDLHAEMNLLTEFEESKISVPYRNKYVYKPGLTVVSSAEPCPMCFIRLATVGVDTKYCATGPDDGMVNRVNCLPTYWRELASKHKFEKAQSSPVLQRISHILFHTYLLDDRVPD